MKALKASSLGVFLGMFLGVSLSACTTTGEVQDIKTKDFVDQGATQDGKVGIKDKKAVIEDNSSAQDELAVLDLTNTHLRDEAERELADLKNCQDQLNDPRLGGSGHLADRFDVGKLRNEPETKEAFGRDEDGELRVVKEQSFEEKLKDERKYKKTLVKVTQTAHGQREECERDLALAREKHGLKGKKYQAKGYFTEDGTWVETSHGEGDLEDAFEIDAKAKAKAAKTDGSAAQ